MNIWVVEWRKKGCRRWHIEHEFVFTQFSYGVSPRQQAKDEAKDLADDYPYREYRAVSYSRRTARSTR